MAQIHGDDPQRFRSGSDRRDIPRSRKKYRMDFDARVIDPHSALTSTLQTSARVGLSKGVIMVGRAVLALGAAVLAIVVTGGSAFAFECFNASRSEQGNASAAGSSALMSLEEVLGEEGFVGLCPEGVEHVIAGLDEAGFQTDILINARSLMAGGLEKNGKGEEKLHDGKGIDHLSDDFFAAADPLIGEGFAFCEE